jgi:hypothetical protein
MGRKSSAKSQSRAAAPPPPTAPSSRGFSPLLIVAIVAAAVAVGGFVYVRNERSQQQARADAEAQAQAAAQQAVADVPEVARKPHPQKTLPPLPFQAYAPPRPPDVVRAAYVFAAEHPEVLSYVPCFCGCERSGHKGNEDCFVSARDANGDVTEWEPHGLECTVCIDVATQARQMFTSGADVASIRSAVEQKWAGFHGGHTPTPHPTSDH